MNPHERAARAEKVLKLVRVLDSTLRICGVRRDDAPLFLVSFTPKAWSEVARAAGCLPPSETTIRAVIAHYEVA